MPVAALESPALRGPVPLGAATTTLSTALNFGPTHALAWTTPQALQALGIATCAAALLSLVPRRVAAGSFEGS